MIFKDIMEIPREWGFKKNITIRREGIEYPYHQWQIDEIIKCKEDIEYFYSNYIYILSLDRGFVKFEPYEYQKTMIYNMWNYRNNIFSIPRQSGKTTTTAAFFLYLVNFYPDEICGIVANKEKVALEIMGKIINMYKRLPFWLKQGITNLAKSQLEFENGSRIVSETTSEDSLRSFSIKNLYCDELSSIHDNLAEAFLTAISPTLASSKTSRMIISSTQKGYTYFAKLWNDAKNGVSEFVPFEINWFDVPGRDESFKEKIIAKFGENHWNQEYENKILSSGHTLINGAKLSELVHENPIQIFYGGDLKVYRNIDKKHIYVLVGDVAKGTENDYSTFTIFDVSIKPFIPIMVYRNNKMAYKLFSVLINEISKQFNNLIVIIENNDLGEAVLSDLNEEIGENVILYFEKTKLGINTNKKTKKTGCKTIKDLIEYDKIKILDYNTINEFYKFVNKGESFSAEDGATDDLVMNYVLFGYFTTTDKYKEIVDDIEEVRDRLYEENEKEIIENTPFFGFINPEEEIIFDI